MMKIRDLLCAGCHVIILITDLHAFLDNMKSPLEKIAFRSTYYQEMIKSMLDSLGISPDHPHLTFIKGSSYQLMPDFTMDMYKLKNITRISNAQKTSAEVIKHEDDPFMTSLDYPLMQALDEKYLDADGELGGIDQRRIFMYSRDYMTRIGYDKKCFYLMNSIIPSLSTVSLNGKILKMSSSESAGKIDLLDNPKQIEKVIKKTYCLPGNIDDNTLLMLLKSLIFPILTRLNKPFIIHRSEKYGGILEFTDINLLVLSFSSQKIHPSDLKMGIVNFINTITLPIRQKFATPEMQQLLRDAY